MSCIWWMRFAFFTAGFCAVFAVGNYLFYRRTLRGWQKRYSELMKDYHRIQLGPLRWSNGGERR